MVNDIRSTRARDFAFVTLGRCKSNSVREIFELFRYSFLVWFIGAQQQPGSYQSGDSDIVFTYSWCIDEVRGQRVRYSTIGALRSPCPMLE